MVPAVLPFLAIDRQIRDFGPRRGDKNFGVAIDRQLPNSAISSLKDWRFWRISEEVGEFGDFSWKYVDLAKWKSRKIKVLVAKKQKYPLFFDRPLYTDVVIFWLNFFWK